MNTAASSLARGARLAAWIGGGALLPAAIWTWCAPDALAVAWRCAAFACIGPAMGSLVFSLIHRLTGGEWGRSLRPFLLGGARLLPWTWLLVLPLVVYALLQSGPEDWRHYGSAFSLAIRAGAYGAVFAFLATALSRAWPRAGENPRWNWVGAAGVIVVLFMTHLLVADWLSGFDAHWHSTAFPVVWLSGQAVSGLAAALLAANGAGTDNPARPLDHERQLGIDWGTLLFAAAMFWCYVAYSQYLIIWSGNLPQETIWYTGRLAGVWHFVPAVLLLLHFLAPLVVLLSRRAKRNPRALALIAGLLLAGQWLHTAWVILPASPGPAGAALGLALLLSLALGGLFTSCYLTAAQREVTT